MFSLGGAELPASAAPFTLLHGVEEKEKRRIITQCRDNGWTESQLVEEAYAITMTFDRLFPELHPDSAPALHARPVDVLHISPAGDPAPSHSVTEPVLPPPQVDPVAPAPLSPLPAPGAIVADKPQIDNDSLIR